MVAPEVIQAALGASCGLRLTHAEFPIHMRTHVLLDLAVLCLDPCDACLVLQLTFALHGTWKQIASHPGSCNKGLVDVVTAIRVPIHATRI